MDNVTRDRVRVLVRDALNNAPVAAATPAPLSRFVDVAPSSVAPVTEYDRDESAKTVITETDLRGLESGARVREPKARGLPRRRRIMSANTASFWCGAKSGAVRAGRKPSPSARITAVIQ